MFFLNFSKGSLERGSAHSTYGFFRPRPPRLSSTHRHAQHSYHYPVIRLHRLILRTTQQHVATSTAVPDSNTSDAACEPGQLGRAYLETDETGADEATIVENILSGQYSCPLRVVAFNTAEGWARDVIEDIAWAVLTLANRDNRSIGKSAQEFLKRTIGVDAPVCD